MLGADFSMFEDPAFFLDGHLPNTNMIRIPLQALQKGVEFKYENSQPLDLAANYFCLSSSHDLADLDFKRRMRQHLK